MYKEITGRENKLIKETALLLNKSKRKESDFFIAEGEKLLFEAIKSKIEIERLFFTKDALKRNSELLNGTVCNGKYLVPSDILKKISESVTPQGIVAVCRKFPLVDKESIKEGKYLAFQNISDPSNAGAVLRSAEAFGADGVIFDKESIYIYSPKVIRSSMGSVFRVKICLVENLAEFIKEKSGFKSYCTALKRDAKRLCDVSFDGNVIVAFGNEAHGADGALIDACDETLFIPISENTESLNLSVAASVTAYEMSVKKYDR